jgi:RNA polymerase sigma-70 factor (ECF subfamily)
MGGQIPFTEDLFRCFHNRLKHFVLRRVPDASAAEGILQEVFLKIHSTIETLRDESKVEAWIFEIARDAVADHFRSIRTVGTVCEVNDRHELPSKAEEMKKISAAVAQLIKLLPPLYRDAIVKIEYEGLTQKELARREGISISTAKSRVQRARAMLKN